MNSTERPALPGSSAYFNQKAEEYGSWYDTPSHGGHALRVRLERALELLRPASGRVVDVGCGPGVATQVLLDRGYDFWGVDAAPKMIDAARRRYAGHERAHFQVGDVQGLSFPDGFFDTLLCMGVVDRLPDLTRAVQEMTRVVKKGGTLLIAFPNLLSPYTAWKGLVFYPAVAVLRPLYYFLVRRPRPHAIPVSLPHLMTARGAARLLARHGAQVETVVYYNFNILLAPLDEILPRRTVAWTASLERLRNGPLRWLGSGFILKARKIT